MNKNSVYIVYVIGIILLVYMSLVVFPTILVLSLMFPIVPIGIWMWFYTRDKKSKTSIIEICEKCGGNMLESNDGYSKYFIKCEKCSNMKLKGK